MRRLLLKLTQQSKITTQDIEYSLLNYSLRDLQQVISVLRFTGLGPEADLLCLNMTGYLTEFEIKVSYQDFKIDALKSKWHIYLEEKYQTSKKYNGNPFMPNYFYYCYPKGLIKIDEIPEFAGAYEVYRDVRANLRFNLLKKAPRLSKTKCNPRLMRTMIRSLNYKLLNALKKGR